MSGGAWGYLSHKFEEAADRPTMSTETMRLMAVIEHELDWGVSGDTCHACANKRVLAALPQFFEDGGNYADPAIHILRDRDNLDNMCLSCRTYKEGRQQP